MRPSRLPRASGLSAPRVGRECRCPARDRYCDFNEPIMMHSLHWYARSLRRRRCSSVTSAAIASSRSRDTVPYPDMPRRRKAGGHALWLWGISAMQRHDRMRKDTSRSLRFNRRITDRVLSMSRQKVSRLLRANSMTPATSSACSDPSPTKGGPTTAAD
jgi:hypothetical protein